VKEDWQSYPANMATYQLAVTASFQQDTTADVRPKSLTFYACALATSLGELFCLVANSQSHAIYTRVPQTTKHIELSDSYAVR
jgi:hypothetical protein